MVWFSCLVMKPKLCVRESLEVGLSNKLSHIVIPFICDVVSVVGNNLYKYQEHMRKFISKSGQLEGSIFFGDMNDSITLF